MNCPILGVMGVEVRELSLGHTGFWRWSCHWLSEKVDKEQPGGWG